MLKFMSLQMLRQFQASNPSLNSRLFPSIKLYYRGDEVGDVINYLLKEAIGPIKLINYPVAIESAFSLVIQLVAALETGMCPQGLEITLDNLIVSDEIVSQLVRALSGGHCPAKLSLVFSGSHTAALAKAIGSDVIRCCPKDLKLNFGNASIDNTELTSLSSLLFRSSSLASLTLSSQAFYLHEDPLAALLTPLSDGKWKNPFELRFAEIYIIEKYENYIVSKFSEVLTHRKLPDNFKLNISSFKLIPNLQIKLFPALISENCPNGLYLDLMHCDVQDFGADLVRQVLQSGKCAKRLKLNLSYNNISDYGQKLLAGHGLIDPRCPKELELDLSNNDFTSTMPLENAVLSGQTAEGLHLKLRSDTSPDFAIRWVGILVSGKCPKGFKLTLSEVHCRNFNFLWPLTLNNKKLPEDYRLTIEAHSDAIVENIKFLTDSLINGTWPENIEITLYVKKLSKQDFLDLRDALKHVNCSPLNLKLICRKDRPSPLIAEIYTLLKSNEVKHAARACVAFKGGKYTSTIQREIFSYLAPVFFKQSHVQHDNFLKNVMKPWRIRKSISRYTIFAFSKKTAKKINKPIANERHLQAGTNRSIRAYL